MNAFDDGYFDFVIAHGVIEHVGDYSQPVGHSGSNLHQQYRLVRELGRVTRIGGHALISTGNYLFPRDGEVDLWFYHWLPRAEKEAYNRATNRSTDRYYLLTWDEFSYLLNSAGFSVRSVSSPDTDHWDEEFLEPPAESIPRIGRCDGRDVAPIAEDGSKLLLQLDRRCGKTEGAH